MSASVPETLKAAKRWITWRHLDEKKPPRHA